MSITDELREYVQDWRDAPSLMDDLDRGDVDGILEDFIRIADRIDERHRKALEKVASMVDEPDEKRGRTDALERRIDRLDGMLDGMGKGAASRIEAIEGRVGAIERKLNHKGGAE